MPAQRLGASSYPINLKADTEAQSLTGRLDAEAAAGLIDRVAHSQ